MNMQKHFMTKTRTLGAWNRQFSSKGGGDFLEQRPNLNQYTFHGYQIIFFTLIISLINLEKSQLLLISCFYLYKTFMLFK